MLSMATGIGDEAAVDSTTDQAVVTLGADLQRPRPRDPLSSASHLLQAPHPQISTSPRTRLPTVAAGRFQTQSMAVLFYLTVCLSGS